MKRKEETERLNHERMHRKEFWERDGVEERGCIERKRGEGIKGNERVLQVHRWSGKRENRKDKWKKNTQKNGRGIGFGEVEIKHC